jgi:tetratricopeptide (TPR) repeat protein
MVVLLYLLFGNIWAAAAAGLLFGLHPTTVESIPWLSERKTLLAMFFSLWSLILYVHYAHNGNRKFYFGCFLMYLLALMSKPTSVPLPAVLILMDYWPLKRLSIKALRDKIPFFVLGGIFAIITYISQHRTSVTVSPVEFGPWHVLLVLCHNIIFYLFKILLPINLTAHYAFPEPFDLSSPMVLAGVIGTCVLIPFLIYSLRWTRAALTGWLIFFAAIFPAMGVVGFTNVIAADRFAYLPCLGLLMAVTAFLIWLSKKTQPKIVVAIVLILVCAEGVATQRYLTHWKDTMTLAKYMVPIAPDSSVVHNYLGTAYAQLGLYEDALEAYKQAIGLKPELPLAYYNLGLAYSKLGRNEEAIEGLKHAIKVKPAYAEAYYHLGEIYDKIGRHREAMEAYEQAGRVGKNNADSYYSLGVAYSNLGRYGEAIEAYKQAIRLKPNYAEAYNNLGLAYDTIGHPQDAIPIYNEAIKINPDYAEAHYNLGVAYGRLDRYREAIGAYNQALKIKPDLAEAHNNLGSIYDTLGLNQEAIEAYKQAIKIKPDNAEAYNNLANSYGKIGRYAEAIESYKQAIRIKPDDVRVHFNLGVTYLSAGDKDAAMQQYEILKTLDANLATRFSSLIK